MHDDSYVPTFWRNLLSLSTGQYMLVLCTPADEGSGFLQNLSHPLMDIFHLLMDIFRRGKPLYHFPDTSHFGWLFKDITYVNYSDTKKYARWSQSVNTLYDLAASRI